MNPARALGLGRNSWDGRRRDVFGDNTEWASQGLNDVLTLAPADYGLGERASFEETNASSARGEERWNGMARSQGDEGQIGTPRIHEL